MQQEARIQPSTGRFAAGEDPAKRIQILDGARRAFMKLGFDAASMNDITREAGVSKGTIYVYFQNKEDLFAALIEQQRAMFAAALRDILAEGSDARETLRNYGKTFAMYIFTSEMMPALRVLIGVADRMPHLCQGFLRSGPDNVRSVLRDYLAREVEAGRLAIADPELAARQFIDLATGTFFKQRLFDELSDVPPERDIDRVIESALDVFFNYYGQSPATAI